MTGVPGIGEARWRVALIFRRRPGCPPQPAPARRQWSCFHPRRRMWRQLHARLA